MKLCDERCLFTEQIWFGLVWHTHFVDFHTCFSNLEYFLTLMIMSISWWVMRANRSSRQVSGSSGGKASSDLICSSCWVKLNKPGSVDERYSPPNQDFSQTWIKPASFADASNVCNYEHKKSKGQMGSRILMRLKHNKYVHFRINVF